MDKIHLTAIELHGDWRILFCWWRGFHKRKELNRYFHHDGSQTIRYLCETCSQVGDRCQ